MRGLAIPDWTMSLGAPLELVLKATLILAISALVARIVRSQGAAARHLAWSLGLVAVLLLPLASLVLPSTRLAIPVPFAAASSRAATGAPLIVAAPVSPRAGEPGAAPSPRAGIGRASRPIETAPAALVPAAHAAPSPASRALLLLALAWGAGALVIALRFALALRRARRLALRGWRMEPAEMRLAAAALDMRTDRLRVVASVEARVPMTFGWLRPVIVVPDDFASWSLDRREAVLLHELAHVRRRDWLVQAAGEACRALLWFHPLAHLALARLRAEAEQAADDLVLQRGARASAYATLLLDLARNVPSASRSTAMTSMIGDPFDSRIRAILDGARARGPAPRLVRATVTAAMALVLMAASVVDVAAEPRREGLGEHVKRAIGAHVEWLHGAGFGGDAYDEGLRLHRAGEYERAIASFERAIDEDLRVGAATYNIACGMALLGRTSEAIDWLERAAERGFDLSEYLFSDGDLASLRAEPRFRALLEKHSDREALARLRLRFDSLEDSEDRDSRGAWFDLAMELHRKGDHARAAAGFERAAALEPEASVALYNVACARAMMGDEAAALDALRRAIEAGWSDADHARADGDLALLRGREDFEALLADAELLDGPAKIKIFGWSVAGSGDWQEASARHERFLARYPRSGHGWFQLGFASLRSGDHPRAVEAFVRAHELGCRKGGVTAYDVACALALAGRPDEAFTWLDIARAEGFDVAGRAADDADLASLRSDARFAALVRDGRARIFPRLISF